MAAGGRMPSPTSQWSSTPSTSTAPQLVMGPRGLGRPFTARNRPFTACATTRREAIAHSMSRLEKRLSRQSEQLLLEKIGLREEQTPPTPEEIRMRQHAKRIEIRNIAEQRAMEDRARRLKLEAAQKAAERAESERLAAIRAEEEKAEAMRIAKKRSEAERAAREAATAARIAERAEKDQQKRKDSAPKAKT